MKDQTLAIHAGFKSDPTTKATAVPIYQTVAYEFDNAQHGADLFDLAVPGNIYTRIMNPTTDVFEKRIAALEGGVAACTVGSGQAATAMCIQNLAQAGDNIVASTDLYGGTVNLFKNTLRQQGIEVRFADPADPTNFEKLTDDKTRAYYGESCPNPYLRIFPIKEVAEIGKKFQKIKLVLTDVDGVLTDGGMYYTKNGDIMKRFFVRDGMGVNLLKKQGIPTIIVTKEKNIVTKKWSDKMNIEKLYEGIINKEDIRVDSD